MSVKSNSLCPDCGKTKQQRSRYCVSCGHKHGGEKLRQKAVERDPIPRFWSRVDKSAGADACWIWDHICPGEEYGRFKVAGRKIVASRYSYEISIGAIPNGLCVLHKCDNPTCVNPSHLFLGTKRDNIQDAISKGRALVGSVNPMHLHPELRQGLAERMKNNPERRATGDRNSRRLYPDRYPRGEEVVGSKLTWDDVRKIRAMYETGDYTQQSIASQFNVSKQIIHRIVHNRQWVESTQP